MFQKGALFSGLTVKQNVQVPLREHLRLTGRLADELAMLKIELVGLQPDAADKYPAELSGGMIKRAALARALALDPELVFLDEPTSGLDPIGAAEFDELIATLQKTLGLTVFMVTHDLDSLYCDLRPRRRPGRWKSDRDRPDRHHAGLGASVAAQLFPRQARARRRTRPRGRRCARRHRYDERTRTYGNRAHYALIGAFTLAVIAVGFLSVFWLSGGGTARRHAHL